MLGGALSDRRRLGNGGMGEVYRADDLKLGQPVALKFLPPDGWIDDPVRLDAAAQRSAARRAQVSHPNVCRVYDIGEADGAHRSCRWSSSTARTWRRCCGASAASPRQGAGDRAADLRAGSRPRTSEASPPRPEAGERDARRPGDVRITDFGLAPAHAARIDGRAGTPAYMAPEQLAGREVTAQSDLYALGLVLYELFTGKRAFNGKDVARAACAARGRRDRRRRAIVTRPRSGGRAGDPALSRARSRASGPASALAVAAALPGGDPLAAALAAGETPSPEMVAAAGSISALSDRCARSRGTGRRPCWVWRFLPRCPTVCCSPTMFRSSVRQRSWPIVLVRCPGRWDTPNRRSTRRGGSRRRSTTCVSRSNAATEQPLASVCARDAPRDSISGTAAVRVRWCRSGTEERVSYNNPPQTVSDMRTVVLDTEGRLAELQIIPPQMESAATPPPAPNWKSLFDLAGLDQSQFQPVAPQWTPRQYSDTRAAWEGPMPGWPEQRLRVEAAAFRGRPVFFQLIFPWTKPILMGQEQPSSRSRVWGQAIVATAVALVLAGAVLVARHNLRKGKGDRRLESLPGCGVFLPSRSCSGATPWRAPSTASADTTGVMPSPGYCRRRCKW